MTNTRDNSHFVIATLSEFMRVWDLGEDASLHLETAKGHVTMAFTCKLGPPSAPHPNPTFPPPPAPAGKPRHRGPAQREKNRQRAALYQATKVAQKAVAPATTSSSFISPTSASVVTITPSSTTAPVITPSTLCPVTTSVPAVASSPSPIPQETVSSSSAPVAATTPFRGCPFYGTHPLLQGIGDGPVFGPTVPFIWSAAMVAGDRIRPLGPARTPIKCDKCQYSGDYLFKIKDHRKEKHRLWECLRCDGTFFNQPSFDKHDCDPHPFAFQNKLWKT